MTEPIFTHHAEYRIDERLSFLWYSKNEVINDLKRWIRKIKSTGRMNWTYIMYWALAKYIVTKDKIVITILSYKPLKKC